MIEIGPGRAVTALPLSVAVAVCVPVLEAVVTNEKVIGTVRVAA